MQVIKLLQIEHVNESIEKVIEKNTEISMHVPCFVSNVEGTDIIFIRNELYDINKTTTLMLDICHGKYKHLPKV